MSQLFLIVASPPFLMTVLIFSFAASFALCSLSRFSLHSKVYRLSVSYESRTCIAANHAQQIRSRIPVKIAVPIIKEEEGGNRCSKSQRRKPNRNNVRHMPKTIATKNHQTNKKP